MKREKFPLIVSERGVSAKIRKIVKCRRGKNYTAFVVDFFNLGKRKQVWRSNLALAKSFAREACAKISNGEHLALTLTNTDRMAYLRANEALSSLGVQLDVAAHEYANAVNLLNGRASITEVCRDWIKGHTDELPRVSISKASEEIIHQAVINGRSTVRVRQLSSILGRFARDFNVNVADVTPLLVSQYLSGLPQSERSKKNYRDTLGFFNRFCVLRGYLKKGTDWLDGVQKYSARKTGSIEIYTAEEMKTLLCHADKRFVPFLAIAAFAGLRQAEIGRLDWSEIDLCDGESFIEVRADKSKTDMRRLIPVHDNLKAWLLLHEKDDGKVCPFEDISKQLLKTAKAAKMEWKHNALRHSFISYRVAECADVSRTVEEAGNSVQVIRSNYLRRVKPSAALEWFNITPPRKSAGRKLMPHNPQ